MLEKLSMLINGNACNAIGNQWLESINPYTGEAWVQIPRGDKRDANAAVDAAAAALKGPWGQMTASQRGLLLLRLADLIEENATMLAEIEVRDNGKLMVEMAGQTRYMASWYRYYGGLADKIEGSVIPSDKPDIFNYTKREPVGVVACITPWNSPLLLLAWKLAAALAAGCTAVIKPSEFTSASTMVFARLFAQAGFPAGVINVVTGFGKDVGAPLVTHPKVAKVAFTGSDETGRRLYQQAAASMKSVVLELGGKSPNIVFADADLDNAVNGVISGIFAASGQTCIAGSRALVQRSIHDRFVERLVERAATAQMGDPALAETQVGPVTTPPQFQKVLDYIAIAKSEGAKCVLGGRPRPDLAGGQFVEPTIFTEVKNEMRIAQEEVFGPVLAIIPFEDEEDAIRIANDSIYGLAAGVWTMDTARMFRMSNALEAGTIWVNTYRAVSYTSPFGGFKQSGLGRESGIDAINAFLETKSVWINLAGKVGNPFVLK
ncbi:MAG: aldehyde dehydrogenase [Sphingorhabdus sp.]